MSNVMNTGDVSRRMGIIVTADRLLELGFKPVAKDKRAMLWDKDDYPAMCLSMGDWIKGRKTVPMQDKPVTKVKTEATKKVETANDDEEEL